MKYLKKLMAAMLAMGLLIASSISSFAQVAVTDSNTTKITITDGTVEETWVGNTINIIVRNESHSDLYIFGNDLKPIATVGPSIMGYAIEVPLTYNAQCYFEYSYYTNPNRVIIQALTEKQGKKKMKAQEQALAQAVAQTTNSSVTTPAPADATPANNTAATPNLSDAQIKALWDQAVAIKQAYDAETNTKKKKQLQKEFTAIMDQIPMN